MINSNALLCEQAAIVTGLAPIAPSSSVPDYVSLKAHQKCTIIITQDNGTGPTGSAITLLQASAVANTGEKALAFTFVHKNIDTGASDVLTNTAVAANTFTTDNTADKNSIYVIEVDGSNLDTANSFDCVRLGTANATNSVVSAVYVLWPGKYNKAVKATAITD
jgi:hypothetical protein